MKILSDNQVKISLILLAIIVLIPLVVISFFNNPYADDFSYAFAVHKLGFWNAQISSYNNWSGRYFSNAILTATPLTWGFLLGYKILPVIMLILLAGSIYIFVKELLPDISSGYKTLIALIILISYLWQMPGLFEGIYWASGSLTYQLSAILMLVLFSAIFRFYRIRNLIEKVLYVIFCPVLCIMIVGSNEISMALLVIILSLFCIARAAEIKTKDLFICELLIVTIICSYFAISAPGNAVRGLYFAGRHQIMQSIIHSTLYALHYSLAWLPLLCLLFILFYKIIEEKVNEMPGNIGKFEITAKNILILGAGLPLIISLCFFVGFYSTGLCLPARAMDVMCLAFTIISFLIMISLSKILKNNKPDIYSVIKPLNMTMLQVFLCVAVFGTFFAGEAKNIQNVIFDLATGKAFKFNMEMEKRYTAIRNSKNDVVIVDPIESRPESIFPEYSEARWANNAVALYYNKKAVKVRK